MKTIITDMDSTITESKQKIAPDVKTALEALQCPIIVVSGASREQMEYQLDGLPCTILAQSGNDTPLWKNELTTEEIEEVMKHTDKFSGEDEGELFDNRGCQIGYSMIGHERPQEIKRNYDPKGKIRQAILKQHPFKSKTLQVTIAGTTCLDYTRKDGTKGRNIERWIKENKLNKKDCIFYGDALFKGGNDETVRGVVKCVAVKDPQDFLCKLKGI